MLNRLLPISIVSLASLTGYAAHVCNTTLRAGFPKSKIARNTIEIARNTNGSIRYMNQFDAINYCASLGQRLPSVRELAQLSARLGAAGISETEKDGYYLVSTNANWEVDEFYFKTEGYQSPAGELRKNLFWSSSVDSYNLDNAYVFNGKYGSIDTNVRFKTNAFWCFADG